MLFRSIMEHNSMDKAVNNSDEHITRKYQAHENIKTKKVGNFSFNEPME